MHQPILIGGKRLVSIRAADIQEIYSSWQFEGSEVIAISCRSILIKQHAINGILYRTNETLYILCESDNTTQQIINATMFFSFNHHDQWHTFVKGNLYTLLDETYCYSSSPIVIPSSETVFTKASNILRKVMLYKLPPGEYHETASYAVIDFCRPEMPLTLDDVIIPIYPIVGDMLKVNGDNGDIWMAHVLLVNSDTKSCRVHFYVESPSVPGKYIRESTGRCSVEVIHWDSILGCANGFWQSGFWYCEL